MSNKKNTIVVNLYGGPGAGKSTFMANLFYKLKVRGIEVEMAPEFAKDLVWEERFNYFDEQIYIFAKQLHRINRVIRKVDVCISDSPLQNSYIYLKEENPQLQALVDNEFAKFNNLNFYIKRGNKYVQNGRNENETEAKEVDKRIENLLSTIPHTVVDRTVDTDYLVDMIIQKVNELNPPEEKLYTLQELCDNFNVREGDIVGVCSNYDYNLSRKIENFVLLKNGVPEEYNTSLCCNLLEDGKTMHLYQIGFHWCGESFNKFRIATKEEKEEFKQACINALKKPIVKEKVIIKDKDKTTGETIEKEVECVRCWDENCYAQIFGALIKYNLISQSSADELNKELKKIHGVDIIEIYNKYYK